METEAVAEDDDDDEAATGGAADDETAAAEELGCWSGSCAYLLINEGSTLLIRSGLAASFDSVYLDDHGEMDIGLRRGRYISSFGVVCEINRSPMLTVLCFFLYRTLYLNPERLKRLEQLISQHGISLMVSTRRNVLYPEQCVPRNFF